MVVLIYLEKIPSTLQCEILSQCTVDVQLVRFHRLSWQEPPMSAKHGHEMLKPLPLYASFPCRNFSSLPDLMNELNARFAALPDIVWEECAAPETLSVGMKVRVKTSAAVHNGVGQGAFGLDAFGQGALGGPPTSFKDATIQKVNDDETFDVVFDDDDETKKSAIE